MTDNWNHIEFSADTNNRRADRHDGYCPELDSTPEHHQLMSSAEVWRGEASPEAVADLPEASAIGGSGFDRHHQVNPDVAQPKRRRNPRSEELGRRLNDMKTSGLGWIIEQFRPPEKTPEPCPYCGGSMYPMTEWLCEAPVQGDPLVFSKRDRKWGGQLECPESEAEFVYGVITIDRGCRCNLCLAACDGFQPTAGRPRSHCGQPKCKKAHRRLENQRAYAKRKKKAA